MLLQLAAQTHAVAVGQGHVTQNQVGLVAVVEPEVAHRLGITAINAHIEVVFQHAFLRISCCTVSSSIRATRVIHAF